MVFTDCRSSSYWLGRCGIAILCLLCACKGSASQKNGASAARPATRPSQLLASLDVSMVAHRTFEHDVIFSGIVLDEGGEPLVVVASNAAGVGTIGVYSTDFSERHSWKLPVVAPCFVISVPDLKKSVNGLGVLVVGNDPATHDMLGVGYDLSGHERMRFQNSRMEDLTDINWMFGKNGQIEGLVATLMDSARESTIGSFGLDGSLQWRRQGGCGGMSGPPVVTHPSVPSTFMTSTGGMGVFVLYDKTGQQAAATPLPPPEPVVWWACFVPGAQSFWVGASCHYEGREEVGLAAYGDDLKLLWTHAVPSEIIAVAPVKFSVSGDSCLAGVTADGSLLVVDKNGGYAWNGQLPGVNLLFSREHPAVARIDTRFVPARRSMILMVRTSRTVGLFRLSQGDEAGRKRGRKRG